MKSKRQDELSLTLLDRLIVGSVAGMTMALLAQWAASAAI